MPSVFTDATGNGHDLTITTPADWTINTGDFLSGDNSVNGDGSVAETSTVVNTGFDLRSGNWTIEYWVKFVAGTTDRMICCCGPASGVLASTRWQTYLSDDEKIVFAIVNTAGNEYAQRYTDVVSAGSWHHLVGMFTGGGIPTIYLDGASHAGTTVGSGTANAAATGDKIFFGTSIDGSNDANATMNVAMFAIYSRLLTTTEITEHYNAASV